MYKQLTLNFCDPNLKKRRFKRIGKNTRISRITHIGKFGINRKCKANIKKLILER